MTKLQAMILQFIANHAAGATDREVYDHFRTARNLPHGTVHAAVLALGNAGHIVLSEAGTRFTSTQAVVLNNQRLSPPMSLADAPDVASLAAPTPKLAHDALQVLRTKLAATLYLLDAVREATGTHCALADLVDVVADLRAKAVQ